MFAYVALLLLTGCGLAAAPSSTPVPSPVNAVARGVPLSDAFPLVRMQTRHSFAHDHGDMTTLERVTFDGQDVAADAVLAAIVAKRGGYTVAGGRSDAEVVETVAAFLEAWDARLDIDRQVGPEPSQFLASVLGSAPSVGAYHPPSVEIQTVEGERVVVGKQFAYSHTGRNGNVFLYIVRAFRISDGVAVPFGNTPAVTQLSEGYQGQPAALTKPR